MKVPIWEVSRNQGEVVRQWGTGRGFGEAALCSHLLVAEGGIVGGRASFA